MSNPYTFLIKLSIAQYRLFSTNSFIHIFNLEHIFYINRVASYIIK